MQARCVASRPTIATSKFDTPTAGTSSASASPRAADTEIRMPVKLPGPMPTAIRSRSAHVAPPLSSTSVSKGISRSACPRPMSSARATTHWSPRSKAAAQCAADVSNARITGVSDTNRAHLGHFGDIMAQQVLDPHLQSDGGRGAARASALHMQIHDAAFEPVERDVAAILCHRGTHARVQKFLDLANDLGIFALMVGMARGVFGIQGHNRLTGLEMFHDRAQDGGFDMVPFGVVGLGDGHEVIAEKHAAYALNAEQACGQRRLVRRFLRREIGCACLQHGLAGQEFQRRGVWCGLGLNKHVSRLSSGYPRYARAGGSCQGLE